MNQLNFLQALGWALINSLWQMAMLWIVYQLIIGIIPRMKAGNKASLATSFTVGGFFWFIYTFIYSIYSGNIAPESPAFSGIVNETVWNRFTGMLLPFAAATYLMILVLPVWQFIRNYRFVQIIRNTGLKKPDAEWRIFVKNMAASMGIVKQVHIWLSEKITSPVTIGFLKPIILIPLAAMNNLTPSQLEAIILHELRHIHRYDYFFNLIIIFIRTILYFNPFVKLFVKSIERERENSCDEMVLQFRYKPTEYASALLRLEQNNRRMMMAAAGKNRDLLQRVESILGMQRRNNRSFRQFAFAAATLLFAAVLNILFVVNENKSKADFFVINNEISPYYFFNGAQPVSKIYSAAKNDLRINENRNISIAKNETDVISDINGQTINPGFYQVGLKTQVMPELPAHEELKVKEAVNATKKILEEKEWKELERSYADAFNSSEIINLKKDYQKELDKVSWESLENKLRLSYNEINWDKVNEQLTTSLVQITLDSVQSSLNLTLTSLNHIEKVMKDNNVSCIPDTDISLQAVTDNQQKAKAQLEKIRIARSKKVVKL